MSSDQLTVKAHIYAEDGALLGFIAVHGHLPDTLEVDGRYFQHQTTSMEQLDETTRIQSYDYWEISPPEELDVYYVCASCGRNSSAVWWKCCPEHLRLEDHRVICQVCVEHLHPNDPEFARQ